MHIGHNAARIMGALAASGGSVLASDLRASGEFDEPWVQTEAPGEFRGAISAVQNIDQGVRELEGQGLVEFERRGAVKTLVLTEAGKALL